VTRKLLLVLAIIGLLAAGYATLSTTGLLAFFTDEQQLKSFVLDSGWYGPLAVIGLLAAAIVLSPIPSAPIAVVSGMAYGHIWGTVYVIIGSETGAVLAFTISRLAGYGAVRKWLGPKIDSARIFGSQNMMMALVFVTRLLPFLSFDVVSYAAGLTPLAFWRFALATLAGIIPASFLLAHVGSEAVTGEPRQIMTSILALGAVTLLPLGGSWLYRRFRRPR